MYYLLALLADVGITACFSINKVYRGRVPYAVGSVAFKVAVSSGVSFLLFFTLNRFDVQVNGYTILMALVMAAVAVLSEGVTFTAYGKGPVSLYTVFQMQGGMLLPFLYGVMCGNRLSVLHVVGILLMTSGLILTVLPERGRVQRPSGGFIVLCCLIFLINGTISIVSYVYSNSALGTGPQNFIMAKALMLGVAAELVYRLRPDTAKPSSAGRSGLLRLGVLITGVSLIDSASYFAQLLSAAHLPAIVMYPIITGGTVVLTAAAGRILFGERHTRKDMAGFALSFLATILFAIPI